MVKTEKTGREKRVPTRAEVEAVLDSFKPPKKGTPGQIKDRESLIRKEFAHLTPQDLDTILDDLHSYPQCCAESPIGREV